MYFATNDSLRVNEFGYTSSVIDTVFSLTLESTDSSRYLDNTECIR